MSTGEPTSPEKPNADTGGTPAAHSQFDGSPGPLPKNECLAEPDEEPPWKRLKKYYPAPESVDPEDVIAMAKYDEELEAELKELHEGGSLSQWGGPCRAYAHTAR